MYCLLPLVFFYVSLLILAKLLQILQAAFHVLAAFRLVFQFCFCIQDPGILLIAVFPDEEGC